MATLKTINKYLIRFEVREPDLIVCTAHPRVVPNVVLGESYLGIQWGDYDGDAAKFQQDSGYALDMASEAVDEAERNLTKLVYGFPA